MKVPNNNLVAIAYKTGYCGSLMYTLFALSPEVQHYSPGNKFTFNNLKFNNSTSHNYSEMWFNKLHSHDDSLDVSEDKWEDYLTNESRQALKKTGLILFRCHPNTVSKLSFIDSLKVVYLTHKDRYIPERWAYEKCYKFDDKFYQRSIQKRLNSSKTLRLTNVVKRDILVKNLNHHVDSYESLSETYIDRIHQIKIEQILDCNYEEYFNACVFLKITAMPKSHFLTIINTYNSKQWKRF